jgi:hypothetical protein
LAKISIKNDKAEFRPIFLLRGRESQKKRGSFFRSFPENRKKDDSLSAEGIFLFQKGRKIMKKESRRMKKENGEMKKEKNFFPSSY